LLKKSRLWVEKTCKFFAKRERLISFGISQVFFLLQKYDDLAYKVANTMNLTSFLSSLQPKQRGQFSIEQRQREKEEKSPFYMAFSFGLYFFARQICLLLLKMTKGQGDMIFLVGVSTHHKARQGMSPKDASYTCFWKTDKAKSSFVDIHKKLCDSLKMSFPKKQQKDEKIK